jgi:Na+/melibiose symporter-like transporter
MTKMSLYHYGLLALPLAFAGMPLYLHIPDLYATQFGLSLASIGGLLLGIRLFDAVQDPIIGVLTKNLNRDKNKLGKLVLCVAIIMAVSMYLLVTPNNILPTYLWFALFMVVCTTAFSVLSIIYQSVGAVWKKDYHQRTQITTTREAIGLVGVTLAAVLPAILGFQMFAAVFAMLIIAITFIWLRWLKTANFESLENNSDSKLSLLKLKSARPLFIIWFLSQLSSAIPVVLVMFFIHDNLQLKDLTGLFLLLYFISGVLGMPLWRHLEKKFGKQKTWQISMFLAVAAFVWAYFLGEGDTIGYGIVCVFSGIALGAELAIPPSILADKISQSGADNNATQFFGISTFLGKFALALASGTVLPLLAYWGYSPTIANSPEAINSLVFCYTLLPCAIKLITASSLQFINLEGEKNEYYKQT